MRAPQVGYAIFEASQALNLSVDFVALSDMVPRGGASARTSQLRRPRRDGSSREQVGDAGPTVRELATQATSRARAR